MKIHSLEQSILDAWPVARWSDRRVLVAVSGGPDSVACLCGMLRVSAAPELVSVGHFNHRWRGIASDQDARFVRQLCSKLNVELVEGVASEAAVPKTEGHARSARYSFLTNTAYELGAGYVVTGHTADDRIETSLHNLFRGTGLAGIAGPRMFRSLGDGLVLSRPLLAVFRDEIIDYLNCIDQGFRSDSSNLDERYSRNFVRRRLLPLAREHYAAGVDRQILSLAELAEETIRALGDIADIWLQQMDRASREIPRETIRGLGLADPWLAPAEGFSALPWPAIREGLKRIWADRSWPLQSMNRMHWNRVRDVLSTVTDATNDRQTLLNLPGDIRIVAIGQWRVIGRPAMKVETIEG